MDTSLFRNVGTLARRELGFYFNSPIAYVVITAFLVVCGIYLFAVHNFFEANEATMRPLFREIPLFFIFFVPAITMRLISEEKRAGTIELLVTMPVTDTQIAIGKYVGGLGFLAVALLATLPLPILVASLGSVDVGMVIGGYVGVFLVGAAYLAIGLMTSAWTENQIVAYLLAAVLCGFFYGLDSMVGSVWDSAKDAFAFMSFEAHFNNVAKGVIDTRDLVFYLSVIAVALVITVQSLQSRNWK